MMPHNTKIFFLNVGFGECTIIHIEGLSPKTIVIDCGDDRHGIYEKSPYRVSLGDFLHEMNIEVIDLLILTHPHRDHIGGLKHILKDMIISECWYTLELPSQNLGTCYNIEDDNMMQALRIYSEGLEFLKGTSSCNMVSINSPITYTRDHITIHALPPQLDIIRVQNLMNTFESATDISKLLNTIDKMLNTSSLVTYIKIHDYTLLLTSDIPISFWKSQGKHIKSANILQCPHHGDTNYISPEFLNKMNPSNIVISADNEFTFELPSRGITEYVQSQLPDCNLLFTEKKHTNHRGIYFTINSTGLHVNSM